MNCKSHIHYRFSSPESSRSHLSDLKFTKILFGVRFFLLFHVLCLGIIKVSNFNLESFKFAYIWRYVDCIVDSIIVHTIYIGTYNNPNLRINFCILWAIGMAGVSRHIQFHFFSSSMTFFCVGLWNKLYLRLFEARVFYKSRHISNLSHKVAVILP